MWRSGSASALHAEGLGFKPRLLQLIIYIYIYNEKQNAKEESKKSILKTNYLAELRKVQPGQYPTEEFINTLSPKELNDLETKANKFANSLKGVKGGGTRHKRYDNKMNVYYIILWRKQERNY